MDSDYMFLQESKKEVQALKGKLTDLRHQLVGLRAINTDLEMLLLRAYHHGFQYDGSDIEASIEKLLGLKKTDDR